MTQDESNWPRPTAASPSLRPSFRLARASYSPAGTLLAYQGNGSGNAAAPTGIHLHFSIVKSTPGGGYADETDIANIYERGPFLGVTRNAAGVLVCDTP